MNDDPTAAPDPTAEPEPDHHDAFGHADFAEMSDMPGIGNELAITTLTACCKTFDDALVWLTRQFSLHETAGQMKGEFAMHVHTHPFTGAVLNTHFDTEFCYTSTPTPPVPPLDPAAGS